MKTSSPQNCFTFLNDMCGPQALNKVERDLSASSPIVAGNLAFTSEDYEVP